MKIRLDFVTNSSSSSFIIAKNILTRKQREQILNHFSVAEELGLPYSCDNEWSVYETDSTIRGWTILDNFDFSDLFQAIGVDLENVNWDDSIDWDSENITSEIKSKWDSLEEDDIDDEEDKILFKKLKGMIEDED